MSEKTIIYQKFPMDKNGTPIMNRKEMCEAHKIVKDAFPEDYNVISSLTDISVIAGDAKIIAIDTKEYSYDELKRIINSQDKVRHEKLSTETNEKVDHLYNVVKGYIGDIEPTCDSCTNEQHLENLKIQINLVEELLQEIKAVTRFSTTGKFVWAELESMSNFGKVAEKALKCFREYFVEDSNAK